jgi:hypothetical protein
MEEQKGGDIAKKFNLQFVNKKRKRRDFLDSELQA